MQTPLKKRLLNDILTQVYTSLSVHFVQVMQFATDMFAFKILKVS